MTIRKVVLMAAAAIAVAAIPVAGASRVLAAAPPGDDRFTQLVTLETPETVARHEFSPHVDVRFFDSPESITYESLSFRYGLASNLEVGIRGTNGTTHQLSLPAGGSILYGGRDVEIFGKYALGTMHGLRVGVMGGVSSPDTPAQNQATGTAGLMASMGFGGKATVYLNPRAVFIDHNTIVGIGGGASYAFSDHVALVGDYTGIVSGDNTRDTSTGALKRRDVWGVALRFSSPTSGNGRLDLDLGYTNATGTTTGFSLRPGLGESSAFFVALRVRR